MIRFFAVLALLVLAFAPLTAQDAAQNPPPPAGDQSALSASPYKNGDQAISLSASAVFPLAVLPSPTGTSGLNIVGAGFGFSYRYFLDHQWAVGGSIGGAFNSTIALRSLFTAPLAAEVSYWMALVPFEFVFEGGLGGYLMRLENNGMVGPFAKIGASALWRTGSGWSVGLKTEGWVVPELHIAYPDFNRTGLLLETGLVAVYHL